jgi:hypothetical protein
VSDIAIGGVVLLVVFIIGGYAVMMQALRGPADVEADLQLSANHKFSLKTRRDRKRQPRS